MYQEVECQPDARRSLRRAVCEEVEVLCESWERPALFYARNVSDHGMWIATASPLPVGVEVLLTFPPAQDDGAGSINALAVVRRMSRGHLGEPGMGVEFLDLDPKERARLIKSLRGLPPPLPKTGHRGAVSRELIWVGNAGRQSHRRGHASPSVGTLRFSAIGDLVGTRATADV